MTVRRLGKNDVVNVVQSYGAVCIICVCSLESNAFVMVCLRARWAVIRLYGWVRSMRVLNSPRTTFVSTPVMSSIHRQSAIWKRKSGTIKVELKESLSFFCDIARSVRQFLPCMPFTERKFYYTLPPQYSSRYRYEHRSI